MSRLLSADISLSYYKGDYVFWHAKIEIEAGKIYKLVGEIGSGKTTLFEALTLINKEWQGDICGANPKDFKPQYSMSFLTSEPVLFENRTVKANID